MSKVAFAFPGQGSQSLGMLAGFTALPTFQHTFTLASQVIGEDLWGIAQSDETKLNQTRYTQPILLAAAVAIWRELQATTPIKADFLLGHSLGEYAALVCAEALSFEDAMRLVSARADAMQKAVPVSEGFMAAAIGLDDELVCQTCEGLSKAHQGVVFAANYNAPGQVVIAGEARLQSVAVEALKEAGAKRVLPLQVSVPSHCPLMQPACDALEHLIDSVPLQMPIIPVLHNLTAKPAANVAEIRAALKGQLTASVLWSHSIQSLIKDLGVTEFYECGPGKVLTGLGKRIDRSIPWTALSEMLDPISAATKEPS